MKIWLLICTLTLSLMAPSMSFGQQPPPRLQTAQGTAVDIDSVGSFLVILVGSDQVRFSVDSGAKIHQGMDDIFLEDIEQGDPLTVRYYEDTDGTLRIKSIIDSNVAGDF